MAIAMHDAVKIAKTQTCNLFDWLDGDMKNKASRLLAAQICNAKEVHVNAAEIVKTPIYCKLGITDAALIMLAKKENCTAYTADLPLYHYASNLKILTISEINGYDSRMQQQGIQFFLNIYI